MAKKQETLTPEERLQAALVPESEQPYKVPGNWCWVKVGTVSKAKGGKRLPKGRTFLEEKSDYPYIRVTDFDNESICIENVKYIDGDTYMMIKNYTISSADIYISIAGTIGKVGIIPEELEGANLTENAAKITDINGVYQLYLMLFLKSEVAQNQMKDSTISTTQPKLALFRIEDILLPLSPLSEQQRIVDRIENLFAKLDEAKQKAQDALDSFETRKAAILHKAFTGELTAKWRKEHGVGMESWQDLTLNDVAEYKKGPFGSSITKAMFVPKSNNTYKVYEQGNAIRKSVEYGHYYISEQKYLELKGFAVSAGDIIISCAGTIGEVFKLPNNCEQGIINQALMRVRLFSNVEEQFFIYYFGEILKSDVLDQANGTAIKNIPPFKVMKAMRIDLPSFPEQTEIVRLLDNLLAKEQQAKESAEGVLEQIDRIKKAILARAFRGELGTNDPGEESAVELLKTCYNV